MAVKHKTADELPEIGRLLIISDAAGAMFASLEEIRDGLPYWHLFPFAYACVTPIWWQYYDLATGEVS
jgi:hypothetical protein